MSTKLSMSTLDVKIPIMENKTNKTQYHHGNVRAELLQAAEMNLRTEGVEKLSLRGLAKQIGVSHAAPNKHFKDRQALLDALAEIGFERLKRVIAAALQSDGDFVKQLNRVSVAFAQFATANVALFELMNASKPTPMVAAASKRAFAPIVALIQLGQKQGKVEAGDPESLGLILYATILGITTMINNGLVPANRLTELVEKAVAYFLRGVEER